MPTRVHFERRISRDHLAFPIPLYRLSMVLHRTVGQDRHIGLACEWYTWESLGYPTYVLHRTVGQDRHIGLTCVMVHMGVPGISHGTHGSPWDILPPSYIGQWDRIDT